MMTFMCQLVTPTKPQVVVKKEYVVKPGFSMSGGNPQSPTSSVQPHKLDRYNPEERPKKVGRTHDELLADLQFLNDLQSDATSISSKRDHQPTDSPPDPQKDKPSPTKKTKVSSIVVSS